uniref:Uncharacterized protein n=1 Tax=Ananas comosus var. bracteatus TaxID=296719 RepID=A0A6V7PSM4_ANACO|nr:unnamed protein product [Ananas comosus var. bracteatus]
MLRGHPRLPEVILDGVDSDATQSYCRHRYQAARSKAANVEAARSEAVRPEATQVPVGLGDVSLLPPSLSAPRSRRRLLRSQGDPEAKLLRRSLHPPPVRPNASPSLTAVEHRPSPRRSAQRSSCAAVELVPTPRDMLRSRAAPIVNPADTVAIHLFDKIPE